MVYWKVKDMTSGNQCKDGIGYEGIFYIKKFDSKEEAIEFIKSLPSKRGYVKPYKIFKFTEKGDKGWHENPDASGKAPEHRKVALACKNKELRNEPIKPPSKPEEFTINEDHMGFITITSDREQGSVFLQSDLDKELIYDLLKSKERKDLDNGWSVTIRGDEPRASIIGEIWEAQNEGS